MSLIERIDLLRLDATRRLNSVQQAEIGQFLTPAPTAYLLASMFDISGSAIRLLDPGAGIGSLLAAFVWRVCHLERRPEYLSITAYEIDPTLAEYLSDTIKMCESECTKVGIYFTAEILNQNFIEAGVNMLEDELFSSALREFDCAILNPPIEKFRKNQNIEEV